MRIGFFASMVVFIALFGFTVLGCIGLTLYDRWTWMAAFNVLMAFGVAGMFLDLAARCKRGG